jgi:hypothetical protein
MRLVTLPLLLLRTRVAPGWHADVLQHALRMGFSPEQGGTGIRALFFPMRYRCETGFEWNDAG